MSTLEANAPAHALDLQSLAAGTPGTPGVPLSECIVAQIANELFKGLPVAPSSASSPGSQPSPFEQFSGAKPSGGEAPLSSAYTASPELPGVGAGPFSPAISGIPSEAGAPESHVNEAAPELPSGGTGPSEFSWAEIPSLGDAPLAHSGPSTPIPNGEALPSSVLAGEVPRVGDGSFLSDIGHEVDLSFLAPPSAGENPAIAGLENNPQEVQEPSKGDFLSFGLDSLKTGGLPTPDLGSHFYFLPNPTPSGKASKETGRPYDGHSVRRDFPALNQKVNGKPLIWLDNAATTHKSQSVIDAVSNYYSRDNSNIHRAAHTLAARSTDAFEGARKKVQLFLGASSPSEIIFTKGATEAINLVAQAWGRKNVGPGDEVLVSELEHHANIVPWQFLVQEKGATLKVIPIDDKGQIILEAYEKLLSPRTKIVAIAQVSNVLGTVPPVAIMTQLAHKQGAKVLIDGAQGAPHLPTSVLGLDADFYIVAGHKLFAPTGIGVLYGKRSILEEMPPWQGGGAMIESVSFDKTVFNPPPAKFEAGTPPIAGAVGLGAAIDYVSRFGIESIAAYEEGLMSYATAALSTIPGLRQIGTTPDKVGALAFVIPGLKPEDIGKHLDREGIAVRAGHHCAQPALKHFGLTAAVRPSLSLYNTADDVDALIAALRKLKR